MPGIDDWRPGEWTSDLTPPVREEIRKAKRFLRETLRGGREAPVGKPTEATYARWCAEKVREIEADPLVQRYSNYLEFDDTHRYPHNTEWWHAFGHQRLTARAFARGCTWAEATDTRQARLNYEMGYTPPIFDDRMFGADTSWGPRQVGWDFADLVEDAMPYLWHDNTRDAALWAPLVPHVIQPNAFPFESMFFSFETNAWSVEQEVGVMNGELGLMTEDRVMTDQETWFCFVHRIPDIGAMLIWDRQIWPTGNYLGQVHFIFQPVYYGARWPEDFEGKPFMWEIGNILRMLSFSQAPFLDDLGRGPRRLPRVIRRDYERRGMKAPEIKQVSVLTLRARPNEPMYRNGDIDGEGPGRTYHHSWWVRGHYRWQWFPSENQHRLIPIDQYMKQIGKPLLKQLRDVSR